MNLVFFHGLESGPHGAKYQLLRSVYPGLISPDFQGMDLAQRIEKASLFTAGKSNIIAVGSSFGGLLAARMYDLFPERFFGLVLLAPAVHTEEGQKVQQMPSHERVRVIHGRQDDVVPLAPIEAFCQRFELPLTIVKDGHRLHTEASKKAILQAVESVYNAS